MSAHTVGWLKHMLHDLDDNVEVMVGVGYDNGTELSDNFGVYISTPVTQIEDKYYQEVDAGEEEKIVVAIW